MSRKIAAEGWRAVVIVSLASLALVLPAAAPAVAAVGSVPREVTEYLADGLAAQLADLYGVDGEGDGIDFNDSTTATATTRVFEFTGTYLAGDETETPVRRLNEWVVIVSVDDEVVGVATVIIPAEKELPELSLFAPETALAAALAELPAEAALVRDSPNAAWYFLLDEQLTAIEPGDSGLRGSISLAGFAAAVASPESAVPQAASGIEPGVIIGGVTLLVGLVGVAALLLVPRKRTSGADAGKEEEPELEAEQQPEPEPEPEPEPGPPVAEKPVAKKAAAKRPAAKKATLTPAERTTPASNPEGAKLAAKKPPAKTSTTKPAPKPQVRKQADETSVRS